jgi:hypothetical protein
MNNQFAIFTSKRSEYQKCLEGKHDEFAEYYDALCEKWDKIVQENGGENNLWQDQLSVRTGRDNLFDHLSVIEKLYKLQEAQYNQDPKLYDKILELVYFFPKESLQEYGTAPSIFRKQSFEIQDNLTPELFIAWVKGDEVWSTPSNTDNATKYATVKSCVNRYYDVYITYNKSNSPTLNTSNTSSTERHSNDDKALGDVEVQSPDDKNNKMQENPELDTGEKPSATVSKDQDTKSFSIPTLAKASLIIGFGIALYNRKALMTSAHNVCSTALSAIQALQPASKITTNLKALVHKVMAGFKELARSFGVMKG